MMSMFLGHGSQLIYWATCGCRGPITSRAEAHSGDNQEIQPARIEAHEEEEEQQQWQQQQYWGE